jgi:hypothetical protein
MPDNAPAWSENAQQFREYGATGAVVLLTREQKRFQPRTRSGSTVQTKGMAQLSDAGYMNLKSIVSHETRRDIVKRYRRILTTGQGRLSAICLVRTGRTWLKL